jgi:hypothetical protein
LVLVFILCVMAAWPSSAQRQVLVRGTQHLAVPNIREELRHQNFREVLADITLLTEGKVGEIMERFRGADSAWRWTVKEGYLPRNTNAHTHLTGSGMVTTLNYGALKGATRLSVARTLIHEMVHAYLVLYFRTDTAAARTYPRIVAAYRGIVPEPDLNEVHHREMAVSFVTEIATALREYGRRLGLQADDSVYTDLAWGGLDYHNCDTLAEESKLRIQRRLTAEQFDVPVFPAIHPAGPQVGE